MKNNSLTNFFDLYFYYESDELNKNLYLNSSKKVLSVGIK